MSAYITDEVRTFLFYFQTGAILGCSYDILRTMRSVFFHPKWLVDGEDIIFWILWLFILSDLLYYQNSGVLRGFILLGIGLGIGIYERLFSKHVVAVEVYVTSSLRKMFTVPLHFLQRLANKLTLLSKKAKIKISISLMKRGDYHEEAKKSRLPKKETTK